MNAKEFYKGLIMDAIDDCRDMELLDLVYKLLSAEQDAGPTPTIMEVKKNADNSRDTKKHGAIAVQVLRGAGHTRPNITKMGDWGEPLPGLCGELDCLQSAA